MSTSRHSMAINTEFYKERLLSRQQELSDEIARFQENAKEAKSAEVEDPIDEVTSSITTAAAATEMNIASDTLAAVRAALQRIDSGEFGVCFDCGRPIEQKRLDAVPWTPYCLEDQEKHDKLEADPAVKSAEIFRL